jgi:3-oxoacyl-[acyl-carrier-protein] synthase-3
MRHAVAAGKACLARSHYRPADVRVLVNTGVHRDGHVCEPAIAAHIQHRLGINVEFQGRRTTAFDLLNGACGMLSGLHVLSSLLLAGEAQVGMVVSSEGNSDRRPDPGWTYPPSGAAVMLDLSPQARVGFGAFAFHVHDDQADLFTSVISLAEKRGRLLLRRAAGLEDAYLAGAGPLVEELLERDGTRREEIALVVPAQISRRFVGELPKAIGLPGKVVADLTDHLPDTHSTSMVLALEEVLRQRSPAAGSKLLLLAVGSGVTLGAAVYHL